MPMTVIRTSGRVRHIRPLPSDSTTTTVPLSATAKLAPETATRARRNFSRRCSRAASASSCGSSVRPVGRRSAGGGHLGHEDVADLGAVAMDRRDEDVRRQVVPELDDHLGEVRLPDVDALEPEGLVELDLLGRHRLDLDHLGGAGGPGDARDDRVRLGGVARPVDHAARGGHRGLELLEQRGQVCAGRRP